MSVREGGIKKVGEGNRHGQKKYHRQQGGGEREK